MRYVALLSGGKDSCFNLLHCSQNGHQLVAAASLGPGPGKDEIDSYLYQTVGQDAIQLVADALEVPLLRRVISGTAVQQGSEYGSRSKLDPRGVQGDETEDLFELLLDVKYKFPEVEGVSIGAILSNYQRVRVENVCQRLSLTPLCYLWQRDQSELLAEMIESGIEAILIKVAGIGLTAKHLGKTLAQMQSTLLKLNSMYGAHVCGEGGEYESLTLDSPLFKHRIILEEVETVIHSDSELAPVAYLKVNRAKLQRKLAPSDHEITVPTPQLLSDVDVSVSDAISNATPTPTPIHRNSLTNPGMYRYWKNASQTPHCKKRGSWVIVSNIEVTNAAALLSIEDEVRACFKSAEDYLATCSLDLSHLANVNILISSIELFPAINAAYASFFGTSPPARACVAVDLPTTSRVRLECIAYAESQPHERLSLHVQSLSYWAPANIGPYSQAITVGERAFVSGQIGLVPFSNTLPDPQSLAQETALSLRHVRSVANAIKPSSATSWDGVTQGVISWLVHPSEIASVKRGMQESEFHAELAPTLFAVVKSLPKNALVETQVLLHTTRRAASNEDDDGPVKMKVNVSAGQLQGLEAQWQASHFDDTDAGFAVVSCMSCDDEDLIAEKLASVTELQRFWRDAFSVRFFHTPNAAPDLQRIFRRLFGPDAGIIPMTAIPSRVVATWAREDWDYALCFVE